jgi:hypothetical protein
LLRLTQQLQLLRDFALGFRFIRDLPFRLFRLARRGQPDSVRRGLSTEAKELECALLERDVHHGNFCIILVAEISWYGPAALLMLFWFFCQLERHDASTC